MTPVRIIRAFRDAVFPAKCPVCNVFLTPPVHSGLSIGCEHDRTSVDSILATLLCRECRNRFIPVVSPMCSRCGTAFHTPEGQDHLCQQCLISPPWFDSARSAGLYNQTLMALVHRFKYHGNIRLARPLGRMLLGTYRQFFQAEKIDRIVPVPLHAKRFRRRGFNQAYLLVDAWKGAGFDTPPVEKDVLFRTRRTVPQTGLGRKERVKNIRDAFSVKNREKIDGKKLLLVDDVLTTGATINECARVLRAAGAERVDVLTLARA